MSNLGKIYQINFENGYKIKYPVVYENKTYWYCKEFGSDMLKWFRKDSDYYQKVIPLVKYLQNIEEYKTHKSSIYVYIAPHEKYEFEETKFTFYDKLIADKQRAIENHQKRIENIKEEIKDKQYEIDKYLPQKIEQLRLEIGNLKLKQKEENRKDN